MKRIRIRFTNIKKWHATVQNEPETELSNDFAVFLKGLLRRATHSLYAPKTVVMHLNITPAERTKGGVKRLVDGTAYFKGFVAHAVFAELKWDDSIFYSDAGKAFWLCNNGLRKFMKITDDDDLPKELFFTVE
jgi:hypothetical protein